MTQTARGTPASECLSSPCALSLCLPSFLNTWQQVTRKIGQLEAVKPRDGAFTKIFEDMRIATKITCLSHRKINKYPVNSGQVRITPLTVTSFLVKSGCAISKTYGKKLENSSLSCIALRESLIPSVESALLRFTDVEISSHNPKCSRVTQCGKIRRSRSRRLLRVRSGSKWTSTITSLTCDDMRNNSSTREEVLVDVDGRSSCVQIIRFKCAEDSELRDKNLLSLEEFILPVNFLKANDYSQQAA